VHTEREHPFVRGEDGVRAVALMDVEIDDRRPFDLVVALKRPNRNRNVVKTQNPSPCDGKA
jgi:hypothetical protein